MPHRFAAPTVTPIRPSWERDHVIVPGCPVAWARARRNGRRYFTAPAQAEHMEVVREAWAASDDVQLEGAIGIEFVFHLPRPKSHYGTGRNAGVLKAGAPHHHTGTPDTSNLVKLVEDALNGLAWRDDAQVVRLVATKVYADGPPFTSMVAWPVA